ncbi:fumarylacetoacetate hydrolase family protein [Pseudalkalibacillus sp. Hm43]|uniref:fumarylacetoacetate hydrolase family protein n=1 Tax=Pseudalkalibacillus sp. Hm43 TaxID=3450742 RepID=UPI003F4337B5
MKFLTGLKADNETFIGIAKEGHPGEVIDLNAAATYYDMKMPTLFLECLQSEHFIETVQQILARLHDEEKEAAYTLKREEIKVQAPIPRPTKNVFCVGKNYLDHAIELGSASDVPDVPMFFSKTPTSVIGTKDPIRIPTDVTSDIDYEGELAVVIGVGGKRIKAEDAYDHVFGYTLLNDVTARDLQSKHKQFLIGKSMDTSCPIGPVVIHKTSIPDPHDLVITTFVNDEVRQQSSTSKMIFSIPKLIEELSKAMTLEPGDIIATGTPAGVGKGFDPPKYLKAGDTVTIEIEQIGKLSNPVLNDV